VSDLTEFYLSSAPHIVRLQLLELSHADFSQSYYLVRNNTRGVTVTHEDASSHAYTYCPMSIKLLGSGNDLDQVLDITLGDVGDIVATEMANVLEQGSMATKPSLVYREYRSDDLTAPLYTSSTLQIEAVVLSKEGAAFRAKARSFNATRTGETYRIEKFPTLAAFFKS
jgi:hypothetical protein